MSEKNNRRRVVKAKDPTQALFEAMAMDVGKELVAYVKVQYPEAMKAASSTFPLSLRNHVYNDIMMWAKVMEEKQIANMLKEHAAFRRRWVAMYRKNRNGARP